MWIATGCVLGASLFFGYTMHQQARCKLYHLSQIMFLVKSMLYEIQFVHRPMQEILEQYGQRASGVYRVWSEAILLEKRQTGDSLNICWRHQTLRYFTEKQCPGEIQRQLLSIGESLSFQDSKQQENVLIHIYEEIERNQEKIRKEEEEKGRLYYPISFIVGLLCVVLFFS